MTSPCNHILIVCHGNICRSPIAEAILRQLLPGKQIRSAGLLALQGQGVAAIAAELARAEGLDVSKHVAQQIDKELIQWADLILVMSQGQRIQLGNTAPEVMGKTMLMGHWLDVTDGQEIPDPYKKSRYVFEHVHKLMHQAATLWAQKI